MWKDPAGRQLVDRLQALAQRWVLGTDRITAVQAASKGCAAVTAGARSPQTLTVHRAEVFVGQWWTWQLSVPHFHPQMHPPSTGLSGHKQQRWLKYSVLCTKTIHHTPGLLVVLRPPSVVLVVLRSLPWTSQCCLLDKQMVCRDEWVLDLLSVT